MGSMAFAMLTGNVGSDPEVRNTNNGSVCTFSIAVNRKNRGEEQTDWYRCVSFYDGLIDTIEKYVRKGSNVAVTGELAQSKWEDRDGNERTTVELLISKLSLNDPPPSRDQRGAGRDDRGRDDRGRDDRGRDRPPPRDDRRDDRRDARRGDGRDDRGREARGNGRDDRGRDDRGRGRDDRGSGQNYDPDLNDRVPF
jgi:single-strand DNA-binding protein